MHLRSTVWLSLLLSASLSAAACNGGEEDNLPACPAEKTELTYEGFGRAFFEAYCIDCHASGSGVSEAQDKPLDSLASIQADAEDIYRQAGGSNDAMPPGGGPTDEERAQLAEWLSCGAP